MSQGLINFFRFHLRNKVKLGKEVLSPSKFVGRWIDVERIAHVDGPVLNVCLYAGRKEEKVLSRGAVGVKVSHVREVSLVTFCGTRNILLI